MTHPDPIKPPQQTVTGVLAAAVKEAPERIFLDFSGIQYSYADIDSASTRLANGLLALGVKQGDRVGTLLDTSVEAILIWFRSEEHTSELQSLMRISYAVFCLKKKNRTIPLK